MEALQRLHMGGHPMPFGLHHPDQAMMRANANVGEERKSPMNLETMSSTIINMVSCLFLWNKNDRVVYRRLTAISNDISEQFYNIE